VDLKIFAMNIFDHLIPDSAILGVGPLMLEFPQSQEQEIVYESRRYFFDLHLINHTTTVRSDWFRLRESNAEIEKKKEWKEKYFIIRCRIAALIKEDLPELMIHEEKVNGLHTNTIEVFDSLLTKLQPVDSNEQSTRVINAEKQRVIDNLLDLKVLALN
jgi:hypothetical protein